MTVVDPEDDGFSADGGIGIGDDGMSAEAGAVVATTMAVAIPSAPSIHTLGGLLAYTGAGLGLVLAMACLLVIGGPRPVAQPPGDRGHPRLLLNRDRSSARPRSARALRPRPGPRRRAERPRRTVTPLATR